MSSGFITETELAEARRKRQEEWEKVRSADQPLEPPDQQFDSRSLYERLKEQKMKKDEEYEETHKLKNLIRGLDDDEVEFLDLIDRTKLRAEKQQQMEERKELLDFHQRVATFQKSSIDEKIQSVIPKSKLRVSHSATRSSQKSILVGAIIRKRKSELDNLNDRKSKRTLTDSGQKQKSQGISDTVQLERKCRDQGAFKCIGILPGIGKYKESSDSEISTDSEEDPDHYGKYDLVGRKSFQNKKKCDSD